MLVADKDRDDYDKHNGIEEDDGENGGKEGSKESGSVANKTAVERERERGSDSDPCCVVCV